MHNFIPLSAQPIMGKLPRVDMGTESPLAVIKNAIAFPICVVPKPTTIGFSDTRPEAFFWGAGSVCFFHTGILHRPPWKIKKNLGVIPLKRPARPGAKGKTHFRLRRAVRGSEGQ